MNTISEADIITSYLYIYIYTVYIYQSYSAQGMDVKDSTDVHFCETLTPSRGERFFAIITAEFCRFGI